MLRARASAAGRRSDDGAAHASRRHGGVRATVRFRRRARGLVHAPRAMAAATAAAAARTTRPCPRKAGGAGRTRTVALRAELRSNVCTGLATGQAEVPSLWWSASFNMSLIVVVASRPSDAMPRDVSSLDWTGYIQTYSCHALSEPENK
mgnify:CR=1 FL=1|jgi:hypothetical protein